MSDKQEIYENRALQYAETYGIVQYRVKGKYMIYNQNYKNSEFINGKWTTNPSTVQRTVNLDTMKTESRTLKKLQKNGWYNV